MAGTKKEKRLKRGWLGHLKKINVSSPFGTRRGRFHGGIDLSVAVGTQIYAPFDGTLTCKFQKGRPPGNDGKGEIVGAGLYAVLKKGSLEMQFMHLSSCVVSEGSSTSVSEGQPIGKTGGKKWERNSGNSRGPHLHLTVKQDGKKIDPTLIISDELYGAVTQSAYRIGIVDMPDVGQDFTDEQKKKLKKGYGEEVEFTDAEIAAAAARDVTSESQGDLQSIEAQEYTVSQGFASGIWQITKLVMDSEVANFLHYDPSFASQQGGLMNFINRICQRPFVEFAGDTYGDMYYFTVRRPPFDKKNMIASLAELNLLGDNKKYIELQNQYNALSNDEQDKAKGTQLWQQMNELKNKYVINPVDVINSNIRWNNENIYSWYQLFVPYEIGSPDALKYITPAVLFPEFATLYGSRELSLQSPFVSFINAAVQDALNKSGRSDSADARVRSSIKELKYIVESNAYNAFTRSGTVTVTGNRKIKRGTFVSLNLEGVEEIFYVEGVSQDYSIQNNGVSRTTTLQLSHGMVKSYIIGVGDASRNGQTVIDEAKQEKAGTHKFISYFDIIDFGESKKDLNFENWKEGVSTWKVNRDVFNFFMKRLQMITPEYY